MSSGESGATEPSWAASGAANCALPARGAGRVGDEFVQDATYLSEKFISLPYGVLKDAYREPGKDVPAELEAVMSLPFPVLHWQSFLWLWPGGSRQHLPVQRLAPGGVRLR